MYNCSVIVVNLSAQMMKRDLLTFCDVIVNDASGIRTSLICRQHSTHPEKIVLQCVRSEIAASRIRYLKDNGYTLGLEEDIQFRMCDGENLEITFDLNLGLVDIGEDGILRLCYFSHLDTAQFVGDLFLVDERAQSQEPVFSGDLYFNVGSVKQRPPRTGCIKITLPKVKRTKIVVTSSVVRLFVCCFNCFHIPFLPVVSGTLH